MNQVKLNTKLFNKLCHGNTKTLEQIVLKLTEETGEVAQALLSYTGAQGSEYKGKGRMELIEELVDVTMVVESLLHKLHVADCEFNTLFNEKLKKWEEKTK